MAPNFTLSAEQAMEEARSWANFWTGLAVSVVAISALPAVFSFAGMGLSEFLGIGPQGFTKMVGSILVGVLLGRVFQTQAILTLRRAAAR